MFRIKKRIAALVAIGVATPVIMLSTASGASAASTITWSTGGKCLTYGLSTLADNVQPLDHLTLGDCSAPTWSSVWFIDTQVVSGVWLEHPDVDASLCLTGYKHRVYFEKCQPGNNWERWQEISSGGNWYLWNVAEGEYLNAPNSLGNAYTSSFPQAWH